ncbi:NAC domain-containing protein 83-like [Vigna umbellata]|uniref:NAC domain-containing protein 83-like n=1 Tax=Vigna umbellata TaxID=87088 RepID=UPI001F5E4DF3|nr:NAC domain-containing protein 83-like [Vigna umbellata]
MEGLQEGFVVKGGIKLPIGFRFRPTDQELLLHYLKKKAFSQQLPASVIPICDVFQSEPWLLPGDLREKRYFFSNCGKVNKRSAGSGCWKCVGKENEIRVCENNEVIGMKKTMMFCKGSHETRTRWVMHELRLLTSYPYHQMAVADFAVYVIFQKRKKMTKASQKRPFCSSKLQRVHDVEASIIDFEMEFGNDNIVLPPPSSPC